MSSFFFISSNTTWGASEYLWYQTMVHFNKDEMTEVIGFATKYDHLVLRTKDCTPLQYLDLNKNSIIPGFFKRQLNKLTGLFPVRNRLLEFLDSNRPDLVVISQGTNIGSEDIISLCASLELNYVIITHLVNLANWLQVDEQLRVKLAALHEQALKSYFVSHQNESLHSRMLGLSNLNADVVYNPISFHRDTKIPFPQNEVFQVAIVGRLECYHKGLDIIFDVIESGKWGERNIQFNFYGEGPHEQLLRNRTIVAGISQVSFHGFASDIVGIWGKNEILLLPSRMEGQSISLSEALALNRTVIATAVGGVQEWIEDDISGFIAAEPTKSCLENAMERAWERRYEWESIGVKAGERWRAKTPEDPIAHFATKLKSLMN